jgi:TPR repeat protein
MVELSTIVVDEIMKEWGLGKHENNKFNMSNKNIELEEILKQFNYSEENIENIIREYSDTVESLITGQSSLGEIKRRNQFAEHMAIAALKGNYKGIAYSCFVNHGGIFENLLPISIVDFSDKAFEFLLVLLNKYIKFKFSESFERYLKNNKNEVLDLANHDNKYAQFLVGFWYVFDKNEINSLENRMKWYEKSALNGYSLAMFNIANFYDNANENLPTNLKKAAYWYRATALQKNNIFTYNLSVMYLQGDGVSYNKNQAKLWLSYAYTLAEADDDFEKQIKFYAKKSNIELDYNPNMMNDIEVNPRTAELSNLYTDKISVVNYDKKKLIYVVEKKSQHAEGVFAKIYEDLGAFITQNLMNSEDYEDKLMVMAYGYARRTTAAGLFLQGVFSKKDYIHSEDVFRGLQLQTGHTMKFQEDAFAQALNYIQSYDSRLTRELITKIVLTARNEETVCIHDVGGYMSFEEVLKVFIKTNENEEIPF